jgi:hypothetical protein
MNPKYGVHPRVLFFAVLMVIVLSISEFSLPAAQAQVTTVYYAAPKAVGAGDCSAWADACSLQTALAAAVAPAEIWVKEGVHKPTEQAGDVQKHFSLHSGVEIYGGFAGVETARDQRDWKLNLTILSGDIEGDDVNTDGNFIIEDVDEIVGTNTWNIIVGDAVDQTSVLDGFVITAGSALGFSGAGIYLDNGSKPLLANLTIIGNKAKHGGGLHINSSGPTVVNSAFYHNFASYRGGAIADDRNINTTLINCAFVGNVSRDLAGAAIMTGYNRFSGGLRIINSLFSQNYTPKHIAGIYADNSTIELYNVTFSENVSLLDPSTIHSYQSDWTLANVIVWGNHSPGDIQFSRDSSYYSHINITNSDIAGCGASGATWNGASCGSDGGGNVQVDPLFVNSALGNFRLSQGSPLVDAGNNNLVPSGITTDLDGNPRFVDMPLVTDTGVGTPPIVDMGAYETYEDAETPTVSSITTRDPNPTNAEQVRFLVTFSEPVFGVDTDSFALSASGLTSAKPDYVSGGPTTWVVSASTGSGEGTICLDVPAEAEVWDLAGNPIGGLPFIAGEAYTIDRTAPTVPSILRLDPDPSAEPEVDYAVTFSEPVTGVDAADFEVVGFAGNSGASVSNVSGSGDSYVVTVQTGTGGGRLRLDASTSDWIWDAAGNLLIEEYTSGEEYTLLQLPMFLPQVCK